MTSEQDQVFGANPKIGLYKKKGLLPCFNMTHPISKLQAGSLRLQPPIPKAEYFLLGQFSKLNSSGFEREIRLPG